MEKKTIILLAVIVILVGLQIPAVLYVLDSLEEEVVETTCIYDLGNNEDSLLKSSYNLTIQEDGTLTYIEQVTTTIFEDEELYNAMASFLENNENVEYDLENLTIIEKTILAPFEVDEDGVESEVWYKTYINNLENAGYTCS